nr:hypothetical protein [Tanacetum cinerariifolium]
DNDDDDGNDDDSGNDDDGGNDAHDSERTNSDDDENPSFTLKDYEEEEQDEEYMHTPEKDKFDDEENMCEEEDDDVTKELYGDLNVDREEKDADMTNVEQGGADQQNAFHESGFVHEEQDAHVTLTNVHDKTEGPLQSSSILSNFTSKILNLDDLSPDINSLMDPSTIPPPPPPFDQRVSTLENKMSEFNQTNQFAKVVSLILGIVDKYLASKVDSIMKAIIKEHVKAQVSKIMPQIEKYVTESLGAEVLILIDKMKTNKSINRSDIQKNLYNALVEAYNSDKDIITSYGDVVTFKRGRYDQDKDEDPSAGSDQGTKRRKSRLALNLLKGTCKSFVELEYHFEECYKAINDQLDWYNLEGREYPFDLSKPLPLIEDHGRQVIPADYFINNNLEYLKGGSSSSKYVTFTTRTKAANFQLLADGLQHGQE